MSPPAKRRSKKKKKVQRRLGVQMVHLQMEAPVCGPTEAHSKLAEARPGRKAGPQICGSLCKEVTMGKEEYRRLRLDGTPTFGRRG